MSWNQKYRPQTFSQLHLSRVRDVLMQLLTRPNLPHAYLFSGPKGTGKTSASRILAALLNDPRNAALIQSRLGSSSTSIKNSAALVEPDISDEIVSRILSGRSLAVQELDAASNRGIDDVRALKERVFMPPQEGAVSVFILDEAHMLTSEASNALLKVLEEPPSHVVFVLATTEQHKILPTIVSRCYTVEFAKATIPELSNALERILQMEKIAFDAQALELVSQQADGSFRDAVKLLEGIAGQTDSVTTDLVMQQLGHSGLVATLTEILRAVVAKQAGSVSTLFAQLRTTGVSDAVVHQKLLELLHAQLLASLGVTDQVAEWSTPILQFLLHEYSLPESSFHSPIPLLALELKSLELISRSQKKSNTPDQASPVATTPRSAPTAAKTRPVAASSPQLNQHASIANETRGNGKTLCERWGEFVELVATANASLGAFLRSAQPLEGTTGSAVIRVFYSFHKDQLQTSKSQALLQSSILQLCGGTLDLRFEVSQPQSTQTPISGSDQATQLPALAASALM